MKNRFLLLFVLSGIVQAQAAPELPSAPVSNVPASGPPIVAPPLAPTLKLVPPAQLPLAETFKIKLVKDNPNPRSPELFHLTAVKAAPEQVLVTLVTMAGGKATFNHRVAKSSNEKNRSVMLVPLPRSLTISAESTVPDLVSLCAAISGLKVRVTGDEWEFTPQPQLIAANTSKPQRPDSEMNINRNPGKNLPKGARPFEFNGNRLYHVPIR